MIVGVDYASTKSEAILFHRSLFWAAAFPSILWLCTTLILRVEDTDDGTENTIFKKPWPLPTTISAGLLILATILLSIVVLSTNWIFDYSNIATAKWPWSKWTNYTIPRGKYYFALSFIIFLSIGLSINNISVMHNKISLGCPKQKRGIALLGGTFCFLAGALLITLSFLRALPLPSALGFIVLMVGIIIVDYTIVKYNAFSAGRVFKEKYFSSLATVSSLLTVFIVIFFIVSPHPSIKTLFILSIFLTITFFYYENIRELWERKFLDPRISHIKFGAERIAAELAEVNADDINAWLEGVQHLSEAELKIFDAIGKGFGRHKYEDISNDMALSINTIDTHLKSIRKKLQCNKTSEIPLVWLAVNFMESKKG